MKNIGTIAKVFGPKAKEVTKVAAKQYTKWMDKARKMGKNVSKAANKNDSKLRDLTNKPRNHKW